MLIVWATGLIFSKINNLEFYHSGFLKFQPGAWMRREKQTRIYWNYFKRQDLKALFQLHVQRRNMKEVLNPVFERKSDEGVLYVFDKPCFEDDFFAELRPYKSIIEKELWQMLHPRLKKRFQTLEKPVIGVHIRRGDFKLGPSLTPINFFIDTINLLRKNAGEDLPVTVFSDGTDKELSDLLSMNCVKRSTERHDIIDILLLSSSRFLVLSVNSTFSYWAGFLSYGHIIKNKSEWHPELRPQTDNTIAFEGKMTSENQLPLQLLKDLKR